MSAAAFLDRDGVLNEDVGYLGLSDRLVWVAGAVAAVARLKGAGYRVFVVTNQSGVARGYFTEGAVNALHAEMQRQLHAAGTAVDAFAYCPHHPEGCEAAYAIACRCRKPAPGLLLDLIAQHSLDPARSLLIGDKASDLAAARATGVRGVLFSGGSLDAFVASLLAPAP